MVGTQSLFPCAITQPGDSYANSVLQALYFCQPFRDLVCLTPDRYQDVAANVITREALPLAPVTKPSAGTFPTPAAKPDPAAEVAAAAAIPIPPTLFSALRTLYLHISTHANGKGIVSPTSFIEKLKKENELFRSTMHQDAHEFLNYLLNKIMEDLEAEMREARDKDDCEYHAGPFRYPRHTHISAH